MTDAVTGSVGIFCDLTEGQRGTKLFKDRPGNLLTPFGNGRKSLGFGVRNGLSFSFGITSRDDIIANGTKRVGTLAIMSNDSRGLTPVELGTTSHERKTSDDKTLLHRRDLGRVKTSLMRRVNVVGARNMQQGSIKRDDMLRSIALARNRRSVQEPAVNGNDMSWGIALLESRRGVQEASINRNNRSPARSQGRLQDASINGNDTSWQVTFLLGRTIEEAAIKRDDVFRSATAFDACM